MFTACNTEALVERCTFMFTVREPPRTKVWLGGNNIGKSLMDC